MKFIIASLAMAAGLMIADSALADTMPAEVKQLLCLNCHAVDHKVIGPAWRDVGKRYKNAKTFDYNGKQYPLLKVW